jgi:hypothetical protein
MEPVELRDLRMAVIAAQHRSLRQAADAINIRQSVEFCERLTRFSILCGPCSSKATSTRLRIICASIWISVKWINGSF